MTYRWGECSGCLDDALLKRVAIYPGVLEAHGIDLCLACRVGWQDDRHASLVESFRWNRVARAEWRAERDLRCRLWPMEDAPRDGTPLLAEIPGHGRDFVIAWRPGFLDSDERSCSAWVIVEDQEPPDCWTDGVCWDVNEDGVASVPPAGWRPLEPRPVPDPSRVV